VRRARPIWCGLPRRKIARALAISSRQESLNGPEAFSSVAAKSARTLVDGGELFIMTSEWLTGAFTALGAVLGAGATLGSGLIGNRAQRELADANRMSQIADVRREAYAGYLTSVYTFTDRARELLNKLGEDANMAECDTAWRAYLEEWTNLQPKYAPVLIAGPGEIEGSAEKLRLCLATLADQCDEWYAARKNGNTFPGSAKVNKQVEAVRNARSEFSSDARKHVYG
jgi:hypothetical protein